MPPRNKAELDKLPDMPGQRIAEPPSAAEISETERQLGELLRNGPPPNREYLGSRPGAVSATVQTGKPGAVIGTAPQSNAGGKPAKVKRTMDLELQCMARIDRLLSEFDASGQARILAWVLSRNSKIELQHKVVQSDA